MKYILTVTAKRIDGKRHIMKISEDMEYLMKLAQNVNHRRYTVEIYNGKWEFIKEA